MRLWPRPRRPAPDVEFGDRIAELNPDLLEPPSNHGDYSGINLSLLKAAIIASAILLGFFLIVLFAIGGFPKCSKGAEFQIEAGPGQDGAAMFVSTATIKGSATWLSFDPHLAAIRREGEWHSGAGLDLTFGTPVPTPYALVSVGRTYWPDSTERVAGPWQWHAAARVIAGRWSMGLHHWSNGGGTLRPPNRDNLGENFLTFGWRW